jgi:ABC-type multidrug transport system fused ATPase/permease subunit
VILMSGVRRPNIATALGPPSGRVAGHRSLIFEHTTPIIAHRLSTAVDANQILALEQGPRGRARPPHQLLAKGGHDAKMRARQQAAPAA